MRPHTARQRDVQVITSRQTAGNATKFPLKSVSIGELFGANAFSDEVMRSLLPMNVYKALRNTIKKGAPLDAQIADVVAVVMMDWAMEHGATHYTHWFQPMAGLSVGKHNSLLASTETGTAIAEFSGKELVRGESVAASVSSGGTRATFEARGYSAWDPTSPAFILESPKGTILCIPTTFCSWTGEALDEKTPLLRSMNSISNQAMRILRLFGNQGASRVQSTCGFAQAYFLIDKKLYFARPDLINAGRTLFGATLPGGQELEGFSLGSIPERVLACMLETEVELYKLGVPVKSRQNEVAPSQYELSSWVENPNVATDHDLLVMETMKRVAGRYGLQVLLHEKPFAGVSGSGKRVNWSLADDLGNNLLNPGDTPRDNAQFIVFLVAVLRAVALHGDLLRVAVATAANDQRLGANDAPPTIISVSLGDLLQEIVDEIEKGGVKSGKQSGAIIIGASSLPPLSGNAESRNRNSPFAFTGNMFEYRALGSSQSIAGPNVVLNTIVAESLDDIATELEQAVAAGTELYAAIQSLLPKYIAESKKVIFNGDNDSELWHMEAALRGLPNRKSTLDSLPDLISEKSIKLFGKYGVFSERELHWRYEILLKNYFRTIEIESQLTIQIASRQILPTALRHQGELASSLARVREVSAEMSSTQTRRLESFSTMVEELQIQLSRLIKTSEEHVEADALARAKHSHSSIIPVMNAVRAAADKIETVVPADVWPLPSYGDMLLLDLGGFAPPVLTPAAHFTSAPTWVAQGTPVIHDPPAWDEGPELTSRKTDPSVEKPRRPSARKPSVFPEGTMFDPNSLVSPDFNWKTALSLALASDLAYQTADAIKSVATRNWHLDGFLLFERGSTRCFVAHTHAAILISFRGAESLNDWLANLDVQSVVTPYGNVHRGFAEAFSLIKAPLIEAVRAFDPARKVCHLTGHGLGGALATIAACELWRELPILRAYTFGQPRLGDSSTTGFIKEHYPLGFHRLVFDDDIVPRMLPGYSHVGRLYHFDANGFMQNPAAEAGGATSEPLPLVAHEFERLKETARAIDIASQAAAPETGEAQADLADRSLEGIFPSIHAHRVSRYLFAIRNQIPRTSLGPVDDAAVNDALDAYHASMPQGWAGDTPFYPVQVRVRDLSWGPPQGVVVNSQVGPIYSLIATREAIGRMNHDPMVFSLNLSRDLDPPASHECADSIRHVQANAVHSGNINERGDSAVLGLIDTGIDILHEAFLDGQGNSRIEAIWVQRDDTGLTPKKVNKAIFTQDYGTLYTHDQIQTFVNNDLVNNKNTTPDVLRDPGVLPSGEGGHGTHVASIGAGRAVGDFAGGMAPEARIVVVVPHTKYRKGSPRSLGYSNSHQDALHFLLAFKKNRGLPMAVNISLGQNAGAHDGSSDLEKVCDSISENGNIEGFVVVKSAGNERGHDGHARIQAALGFEMVIEWKSSTTPRGSDYLEFWYHSNDKLEFTLVDPAGNPSPTVTHTSRTGTLDSAGNRVHLELTLNVPDNYEHRLVVRVNPVASPIQVGIWTLKIVGVAFGKKKGRVDGWVERNDKRPVLFTTGSNNDTTLSIPGTSKTVVCVAASSATIPPSLIKCSSYGPTRRNGPKPDVNAPGDLIFAACSNLADHQAVVTMGGTSVAAPHVTGAMLLVLSARHKKVATDENLEQFNAIQLAGMLRESTDYYNMLHNKGTGYGALNALAFFKEADLA